MTDEQAHGEVVGMRHAEDEITRLSVENQALQQRVAELEGALRALLVPLDEPCHLDHHGNCQAHFLGSPCEVAEAKQALQPPAGGGR